MLAHYLQDTVCNFDKIEPVGYEDNKRFAMFDNLTERLSQSLRNIAGTGTLTEVNINDTFREVRTDLL